MQIDLSEEIEKSRRFQSFADEYLVDIGAPATVKNRASLAFFHLCLEHQHGLHLLVENHVYGSALALLRPIYESYIRGLWCLRCATEPQILKFVKSGDIPKINPMLADLVANDPGCAALPALHKSSWSWLNDYTHGGSLQIKSRTQSDSIVNVQSDSHAAAALLVARHWAVLAGVAMSDICDRPELGVELARQRAEMDGE